MFEALMTFIWSGEPDSRLTLQGNRDGITLQVTKAVVRSVKREMGMDKYNSSAFGINFTYKGILWSLLRSNSRKKVRF